MPNVIFVAGPNGAGKTSFARQLLPKLPRTYSYLNVDEISRDLAAAGPVGNADAAAARAMLLQIERLVALRQDIMIETTLATRTYSRRIQRWRALGYEIGLVYIRLPSVEASVDRVRRRVAAGGHDIPYDVIVRRFDKSLGYFDRLYKPIVDEWYVWESLEGAFRPIEGWDDR